VGRRCAVAFSGGGAGTVVANDMAQVLHHGEREGRLRWGSRRVRRGTASGSPVKANGCGVSGEIRGEKRGPGVRGQRADSGKDGGGGGMLEHGCEGVERRGEWDGGRWLLTALGRTAEGKKREAGGPGVGATWREGMGRKRVPGRCMEGGNGKNEGGDRRGRRRCRATVEGGGTRVTRARAADGWDRVIAGPGGQRLGVEGRGSTVQH
jgi:hypothetical protein